jgi:hypothetical protein
MCRHFSAPPTAALRYFKQQLLISECNGRISELRGAEGYVIETLEQMMSTLRTAS